MKKLSVIFFLPLLPLLPLLPASCASSGRGSGRGSDLMVPMAVLIFGGMFIELMTMFVVPVLFCLTKEFRGDRRLAPKNLRP